jgi:hypothetical protein
MTPNKFELQEKIEVIDQRIVDTHIDKIVNTVNAEQEYLVARFLKETGLRSEDCVICTQWKHGVHRIWIEKKVNTE